MKEKIYLARSNKKDKKYMVRIGNKTVHFGAEGMSDFTKHKDPSRKKNYISRHGGMGENWNKSGLKTAGFWSRWLLWFKPTIKESIEGIEKKFNVQISRGNPPGGW